MKKQVACRMDKSVHTTDFPADSFSLGCFALNTERFEGPDKKFQKIFVLTLLFCPQAGKKYHIFRRNTILSHQKWFGSLIKNELYKK